MRILSKLVLSIVSLLGITSLSTLAQTPSWEWALVGGSAYNDMSYQVATLPDGSIVIGGSYGGTTFTLDSMVLTHPNASSWADSRFFLARLDENGNVIWLIQNEGVYASLYDVHTDDNGYIYVTGSYEGQLTIDSTVVQGGAVQRAFFAKFDSTGDLQWVSNAYNSGLGTGKVIGLGATADAQGNMYFQGMFDCVEMRFNSTSPPLTNSGINQHFVVKYDSTGNYQWAAQSVALCSITIGDISVDTLGNVFISGHSFNSDMVFPPITLPNSGGMDCYIFKLNGNGVAQWGRAIGSSGDEGGCVVAADQGGNVYVAGGFNSNSITLGSYTLQNNSGLSDDFLCKYDKFGNVLWANKIYGTDVEGVYDMIVTENNDHLLLTGHFMSPTLQLGNQIVTNSGTGLNTYVADYDSAGNCNWAIGTVNTAGDISTGGVAFSNANEVYVTGNMYGAPNYNIGPLQLGSFGAGDMYLAKLNITSTSSNEEMSSDFPAISVYPVPANETCTISFELKSASMVSLSLSDITGRILTPLIDHELIGAGVYSRTFTGYSPGVYFLTIKADDRISTRRVIIQ